MSYVTLACNSMYYFSSACSSGQGLRLIPHHTDSDNSGLDTRSNRSADY